MSAEPEPLVRRETWDRSDKVGLLLSVLFFWGLPCAVLLPLFTADRMWWGVGVVSVLWVAFGTLFWRFAAGHAGKLLIEVTTDGIRSQDDQEPVPWTAVEWVGFRVTAPSLHRSSHTYVVLQLADGPQVEHPVDLRREEVRSAIRSMQMLYAALD